MTACPGETSSAWQREEDVHRVVVELMEEPASKQMFFFPLNRRIGDGWATPEIIYNLNPRAFVGVASPSSLLLWQPDGLSVSLVETLWGKVFIPSAFLWLSFYKSIT